MKRRSPALLAGIVLGGVLLLAFNTSDKRATPPSATAPPEPASPTADKKESPNEAEVAPDLPLPTPSDTESLALSKRFQFMPDGSPVPPLPPEAPEQVKLGIALFRYLGTEAPPKATRTQDEARKLAEKAAAAAKTDFAAVVQSADRGSGENVGWMSRGILEPAVEYAVFTLKVGETSAEPIDTPRGYWVARRIR